MKRLAIILAIVLPTTASAFAIDLTLPNLTFPDTTRTTAPATQSCIQPATLGLGCK